MQEEKAEDKETMQANKQTDGCDGTNINACSESEPASKIIKVKLSSPDEFYEKLTRFHHSSGLTSIFDFREAKVDLYRFYKDVTERGGYYEVTKDGKWDEVVSSLNAESGVVIAPNQIQMFYAHFFHQFEQTYYYRTNFKVKEARPFKAALTGKSSFTEKSSGSPAKKQRHNENNNDESVAKRVSEQSSSQLPTAVKSLQVPSEETSLVQQTPTKAKETKKSSNKEMKQHRNAPMGHRTSYMIFLRMECERLKIIHGKGIPGQIKNMANDAWRRLSEHGRKPYVEASKRDKERYTQEMAEFEIAYNQIVATQSVSASTEITTAFNFAKPSLQTEGQYYPNLSDDANHVTLPHDAGDIMQKAASNDPAIKLEWDG